MAFSDKILFTVVLSNVLCAVVVIVLVCSSKLSPQTATRKTSTSLVVENNRGQKCASQLDKGFEAALQETNTSPKQTFEMPAHLKTPAYISTLKPLAHVQGISEIPSGGDDEDLVEVTDWKTSGRDVIIRNGIGMERGRLIIPAGGWYKFYASVQFDITARLCNASAPLKICLFRQDALTFGEEELACQSYSLSCPGMFTSYVFAVRYFGIRDELYVKITFISTLGIQPDWHYMGVHVVS